MLFAARTFATLIAPWVVYAWATSAFPWLGRDRRRKQRLAAVLIAMVVVDRVSDLMVTHWHTCIRRVTRRYSVARL